MSGAASHLYDRQGPTALVREFMTRPERDGYPTSRRVPIIVFTGSRGCGKTALVNELADEFTGQVPYARIDCGSLTPKDPWDVLTLLVPAAPETGDADELRVPVIEVSPEWIF